MIAALGGTSAHAHGPCGCLKPDSGPAGTRVAVGSPMYKAVFNPDRTDLGIGPESLWKLHHGPPPIVVFRQKWRYSRRPLNRGGTVTVPRVPPGRYLIAIYDGGEGGQHYSWETFTVTAASAGTPGPRPPREVASRGVAIAVAVAAAVVALLVGYLAGRRRRVR